jgi:hypothetical protein
MRLVNKRLRLVAHEVSFAMGIPASVAVVIVLAATVAIGDISHVASLLVGMVRWCLS